MKPADQSFGFSDIGIEKIVTNSREDCDKALFVPIIGEKFDGHDYIEMAVSKGAVAVLSSRDISDFRKEHPEVRFYKVDDTVRALQEIGLMERGKYKGFVLGVTGSVGKTTTRSMTAMALRAGKTVFETSGNQNSQVGVPITMFEMQKSNTECAVVELGMSLPGEMSRISETACLDAAIITNIGDAHIENLGSRENILKEKLHILDGMRDGGTLYLNGNDPLLSNLSLEAIHGFGIAAGKTIRIRHFSHGDFPLSLKAKGAHMLLDAMAAMHVCQDLGVPLDDAANALSSFGGLRGRGEGFLSDNGVFVIDDAYNASPDSMRASLRVLSLTPAKRRVAVLADMLELGEESAALHRGIGEYMADLHLDAVFLYGSLSREIGKALLESEGDKSGPPAKVFMYDAFPSLREAVRAYLREGDAVLFKGSHSMNLSEIVDEYRRSASQGAI